MIKFQTSTLVLLAFVSTAYSSSWDEIDDSLQISQCDTLKMEIDNSIIFIKKSYTPMRGIQDINTANRVLKKLDKYSEKNCLSTEDDKKFYKQEKIYWGTQKYKVEKILGKNPKHPAWSANEAIEVENQRKSKKIKEKKSKTAFSNALKNSDNNIYKQKNIKQLYGKEYDTFSFVQKKFIRENLSRIHTITQRTLTRNGYPTVSARTKQEGTNIVSFYLHPNGDISALKLKKRIGYKNLDDNTLEVIRNAYRDYPLPRTKTKIVLYVSYSLY